MRSLIVICCLIFAVQFQIFSQEEISPDTTGVRGVNWFAYPFIFYTPETDWAFGAGGILYFKLSDQLKSKPSSVTASGYYTVNNQFDISVLPEIYLNQDKYLLSTKFNYSEVFDFFYGIGPTSPDIENNPYFQRNFILNVKFQLEAFKKNFKLGPIYELRSMNVLKKENNPFLDSNLVRGSNGGTTSGFGIIASYDTRDNIFYPSQGSFYQFSATYYSKAFGSDFDYDKYILDARRYLSFFPKHILALQAYVMIEFAYPPFYELALLGGDKVMRGYLYGRYRDRLYYAFQAEYRLPFIWRFGFVVFGGLGDVASKMSKIAIATIKPTYGFGVRFRLDELQKLDLRVDFGFGKDTDGIYFSLNQAF
ncbi:MAG: BamA/TamA family outer membrane protein [Ignavibacteriaceae bacterium]